MLLFGNYSNDNLVLKLLDILIDVITFAALPIFIIIYIAERILLKTHLKTAKELSKTIKHLEKPKDNLLVKLIADNEKDLVEVNIQNLLYIQANDNYSAVCFINDGKFNKVLLRSTLKRMEEQLSEHEGIVRCHKSYLVNLHNISSVSGNTQGYRLHFEETDTTIPVSRNFPKDIIQRIKSKTN